ncbi:hypothetical protein B0T10DRAFT_502159 [Thelonectria olida]|uniref:Uncharacterized protein n=1 Tax=Thelonectria olida TaxID=1576542 RepID=A0A9P8VR43_9HYPO|nr:hypothetical protein B0T10DRAFT_502159 [Thelonectria olida]
MGKKQKVSDYVNNLEADSMTGSWTPAGTWHRIHGDCKSTTGGKWHMETMTTKPKKKKDGTTEPSTYKVKLIEDGSSIWTNEYSSEPSFEVIVNDVQADLG